MNAFPNLKTLSFLRNPIRDYEKNTNLESVPNSASQANNNLPASA